MLSPSSPLPSNNSIATPSCLLNLQNCFIIVSKAANKFWSFLTWVQRDHWTCFVFNVRQFIHCRLTAQASSSILAQVFLLLFFLIGCLWCHTGKIPSKLYSITTTYCWTSSEAATNHMEMGSSRPHSGGWHWIDEWKNEVFIDLLRFYVLFAKAAEKVSHQIQYDVQLIAQVNFVRRREVICIFDSFCHPDFRPHTCVIQTENSQWSSSCDWQTHSLRSCVGVNPLPSPPLSVFPPRCVQAPEFQSRDDFGGSSSWISFPSFLSCRYCTFTHFCSS